MVILTIIGTVLVSLGIFVSLCANISDYGESSEGVNEENLPTYTYPICGKDWYMELHADEYTDMLKKLLERV